VLGQEHADEEPPPQPPVSPGPRPCPVDGPPGGCGTAPNEGGEVKTGEHYDVPVLATDPLLGPKGARVTMVVFSDFQCPFCGAFEETVAELRDLYPADLRIVWKDTPLPMHPHARPAALLARSAYAKGGNASFWEVHDEIFAEQNSFEQGALETIAKEHGLAWPPEEHFASLIDQCLQQADQLGIRATPTSFVNGDAVVGSHPVETYVEVIDRALR
jgi:protein-disulfide isomerase